MPDSLTLTLADGRKIGFIDYGPSDGIPVVFCHGGPGCRILPESYTTAIAAAGFRIIGIDRPGYGLSTPNPGRSIADWVPDCLFLMDTLNIARFVAVGVSTGGAYALALASCEPERILAVVTCCALTDMSWQEGKSMMIGPLLSGIWSSANRDEALLLAIENMGTDGSKMYSNIGFGTQLPPADLALIQNPDFIANRLSTIPEMFAFSVQGYTDDRIADGVGWTSFDIGSVRCPVIVLHGEADSIVPCAHARYTAEITPGATLRLIPELGHFSIFMELLPSLQLLRSDYKW